MEAERHLKIYHPNNITWNNRGQFSNRYQGTILKKDLCLLAAKRKKEKESYRQQHVCLFIYHLRKIKIIHLIKTISGHKRSHQSESTTRVHSHYLRYLTCCAVRKWFQRGYYICTQNKTMSKQFGCFNQTPQVQWLLPLLPPLNSQRRIKMQVSLGVLTFKFRYFVCVAAVNKKPMD